MTVGEEETGSDRSRPEWSRPDPDGERVAQLLAELADDPAAPPSSVTVMSVIAAAKAAAQSEPVVAGDRSVAPDDSAAPGAAAPTAQVIEFRPRRRRLAMAGLVAAASLVGISALVFSLTITGGSSTSTSADGARVASAESAGSFESAAGAAPSELPPEAAAAAPQPADAGDAAAGEAQDNGTAAGESDAVGSGQELAGAACWPELRDRAIAALTDALPPGEFGSPQPLTADCESGAVGGVLLPGTAGGTALVVRVSAAVPAACVSDTRDGTACAAKGDNIYVANDAPGSPVVYAYGNGNQVVVSGWPASGDSVAVASGLTVDQSVAAAQAVLDAVG